ncbi:hypothetical protein BG003_007776, partial [Podila horticola]
MGAQDNAPSVHSENGTVVHVEDKQQQNSFSSKIDTPTKEVLDTASTTTSLDPGPSYPSGEVVTLPFKELMVVFVGLMLGIFLSSLDQTIVSVCTTKIANDFKALNEIPW